MTTLKHTKRIPLIEKHKLVQPRNMYLVAVCVYTHTHKHTLTDIYIVMNMHVYT